MKTPLSIKYIQKKIFKLYFFVLILTLLPITQITNTINYVSANSNLEPATLTSHLEFQTISGPTQVFEWSTVDNAKKYELNIYNGGSTQSDIIFSDSTTSNSLQVDTIPKSEQIIYIELITTFDNNTTATSNYILVVSEASEKAVITTPENNSNIHQDGIKIEWTNGNNIQQFQIRITEKNSNRLIVDETLSNNRYDYNLQNLPKNNTEFVVKLTSIFNPNENNKFSDEHSITFTSSSYVSENASLVSPIPNSDLATTTQEFQWTEGDNIKSYRLVISSNNETIFDTGAITENLITINDLPNTGVELSIDLYSLNTIDEWDRTTYRVNSAEVVEKSIISSPENRSVLNGPTASVNWSKGVNIERNNLIVLDKNGNEIQKYEDIDSNSLNLENLPIDGSELTIVVESIDHKNRKTASQVEVVSFKPILAASIVSPEPRSTLNNLQEFTWTKGNKITSYRMELYVNDEKFYDSKQIESTSITVPSIPENGENIEIVLYSTDINGNILQRSYNYIANVVFEEPNFINIENGQQLESNNLKVEWSPGKNIEKTEIEVLSGTSFIAKRQLADSSFELNNLPIDSQELKVTLYYKPINNTYKSKLITLKAPQKTASVITSHTNNDPLTSNSTTFEIREGSFVSNHRLIIKNDNHTFFDSRNTSDSSINVSNLPVDGSNLSVQLISNYTNGSQTTQNLTLKSYLKFIPATLTSPRTGTSITSGTEFKWNEGQAATSYILVISDGNKTIYKTDELKTNSHVVGTIPYNTNVSVLIGTRNLYTNKFEYKKYSYNTEELIKEPRVLAPIHLRNKQVTNNHNIQMSGGKGIESVNITVKQGNKVLYDSQGIAPNFILRNVEEDGTPVSFNITTNYVDNSSESQTYDLNAIDRDVKVNQPYGRVTGYYVSFKEHPENYEFRYGVLSIGNEFEIYEKIVNPNFDNIWYRIKVTSGRFKGQTGWIAGRFQGRDLISIRNVERTVKTSTLNNYKLKSEPTDFKILNATYLSLRPGPEDYSQMLARVEYGEIMQVFDSKKVGNNTWYKVKMIYGDNKGKEGWIAGVFRGRYYFKDVKHHALFVDKNNLIVETTPTDAPSEPDNSNINNNAQDIKQGTVRASYLTLRHEPEKYNTRIAVLGNYTRVSYTEVRKIGSNTWYKVTILNGPHKGHQGWVAGVFQNYRYLILDQ